MEQVRKALSRAKTAFEKIEADHGSFYFEDGTVIPGREIYEIERALEELEQRQDIYVMIVEVLSNRKVEVDDLWTKALNEREMKASDTYKEIYAAYCTVLGDLTIQKAVENNHQS